jgi:inorganic triphosphatase YgiF
MSEEVELKLTLAEDEQTRFLRHPLLKKAAHCQTETLDNIYYDTPDLALRQRGVALRLRRQGSLWLQTVKQAGSAAAGLASRPEWETPYTGQFDFSAMPDRELRQWLQRPALRSKLIPIFETQFERTTWRFEAKPRKSSANGAVLLTLDRGWIKSGAQQSAISEIELELCNAPVKAIFALAVPLSKKLRLTPAVHSKAARGYMLHAQTPLQPVKANELLCGCALTADLSPQAAFAHIALNCLDHLQHNQHGAVHAEDPEYIHQMRVAMRRLRSALQVFSPQLPPRMLAALEHPLKKFFWPLMHQLGQMRDLDILRSEILLPVLAAQGRKADAKKSALAEQLSDLLARLAKEQLMARQKTLTMLASPAYGHQLLRVLKVLHQPSKHKKPAHAARPAQLVRFAARRTRTMEKHVLQKLRTVLPDILPDQTALPEQPEARFNPDPDALHLVRIAIKQLRYTLDFFAPLGEPTAEAPKRPGTSTSPKQALAALQETLGQLTDLAHAGRWLNQQCAQYQKDPQAHALVATVSAIGAWHAPRYHKNMASLPKALRKLQAQLGHNR